mmetsp:Transcript_36138/g.82363  ORF Transcript_36138/g.82363 Transcript_36138/m.82363 type:complete len:363 (-) Transcript_36138:2902-3990(-)
MREVAMCGRLGSTSSLSPLKRRLARSGSSGVSAAASELHCASMYWLRSRTLTTAPVATASRAGPWRGRTADSPPSENLVQVVSSPVSSVRTAPTEPVPNSDPVMAAICTSRLRLLRSARFLSRWQVATIARWQPVFTLRRRSKRIALTIISPHCAVMLCRTCMSSASKDRPSCLSCTSSTATTSSNEFITGTQRQFLSGSPSLCMYSSRPTGRSLRSQCTSRTCSTVLLAAAHPAKPYPTGRRYVWTGLAEVGVGASCGGPGACWWSCVKSSCCSWSHIHTRTRSHPTHSRQILLRWKNASEMPRFMWTRVIVALSVDDIRSKCRKFCRAEPTCAANDAVFSCSLGVKSPWCELMNWKTPTV